MRLLMSKNVIQKCNAIKMRLLAAKITTEMHRQQKAPGLFTSVQLKRISFGDCAVQTHFFCDCTAQMHFLRLRSPNAFFLRFGSPNAFFWKKNAIDNPNRTFSQKNAPRPDKRIFSLKKCAARRQVHFSIAFLQPPQQDLIATHFQNAF